MAKILAFFLFFMYKGAEAFGAYTLLLEYRMRHDYLVYGFYGVLSLFLLLFFTVQTLSAGSKSKSPGALYRYSSLVIVLMDVLILGLTGYYLYTKENDFFNLLAILVAVLPLSTLFFYFHTLFNASIAKKSNLLVEKVSVLPQLLFYFIILLAPIAFITVKTFIDKSLNMLDVVIVSANIVIGWLVIVLLSLQKVGNAKKTAQMIKRQNLHTASRTQLKAIDSNEFGLIQTELKHLIERIERDRESIVLLNDYISKNMREEISRSGFNLNGERKTASILTVKYRLDSGVSADETVRVINLITKSIGGLVDEYEAYPFFESNKAVLVFGIPLYYDHYRYNAIESAQRITAELQVISDNEQLPIYCHIGIFTGEIVAGGVFVHGENQKEYRAIGEGLDISDKIATACENVGCRIMACSATVDNLKSRFVVDKNYQVKTPKTAIVVHEIRV